MEGAEDGASWGGRAKRSYLLPYTSLSEGHSSASVPEGSKSTANYNMVPERVRGAQQLTAPTLGAGWDLQGEDRSTRVVEWGRRRLCGGGLGDGISKS